MTTDQLLTWLNTKKPGPAWEVHEIGANVWFGQPMRDGIMLYMTVSKALLDTFK